MTTAKDRQAAALQRLKDAGGNRVAYNLTAQALADIAAVRECLSLPTATEAVIFAVRAAASTHAPAAAAAQAEAPALANADIELLRQQRDELAQLVSRLARRLNLMDMGNQPAAEARDYLHEHNLTPRRAATNQPKEHA